MDQLGRHLPGSDVNIRGLVLQGATAGGMALSALLVSFFVVRGALADAVATATMFGIGGVSRLLSRWNVSPVVVTHVTTGAVLFILAGGAVETHSLAYVAWMGVSVWMSFFTAGVRVGAFWSLMAVALSAGVSFYVANQPPVPDDPIVRTVRVVVLVPTLALVAYLYEVTRDRSARDLRRALEAEAEASLAKSRFLAKVSHEIRTPLNGVIGMAEAILLRDDATHARTDVELIRQSGLSLLALVNDVLDVTRAQLADFPLANAPFSLRRAVMETTALHLQRAHDKGVELRVVAGDAPWVVGDELRVRQLLGNLVSNAVKFTPRGAVEVRLACVARGPRWQVQLSVHDAGQGVAPEQREKLFQPFSQLQSTVTAAGTGLGLAICREISTRMGGVLTYAPSDLGGAAFCLDVVLDGAAEPAPAPTVVGPLPRANAQVLVVDDNALNLKVAASLLERLGLRVDVADSGAAALRACRAKHYDLVLLDLQMPDLDGRETCQALLAHDASLRVVALTATTGADTTAECLAAGMRDCLTKPIRLEELKATLTRHLEQGAAAA